MDVWQIVLYGFAALLAVRSLTALMQAHKDRVTRELAAKQEPATPSTDALPPRRNGQAA
jgi:hypothetical protein